MKKLHEKGVSFHRIAVVSKEPVSTIHGKIYRLLKRSENSKDQADKDALLTEWIKSVKEVRSTWGVRRVRAFLKKKAGFTGLGLKRVRRIMRENNLLCPRVKKRIHRKKGEKVVAEAPNKLWATDMTSIVLTTLQRVFLIVVMDVFTRRIIGWHLSTRCRSREWIMALEQACNKEFSKGVRDAGLTLRSDNGSQPTSKAYVNVLETLNITGEWIGYNCPEQNGHIESLIGTLKQDFIWLDEYETFGQAYNIVERAVDEYNSDHPHSSLFYMSPNECKVAFDKGLIKLNDKKQLEITNKVA
ncbi:IS3 family transposase [candidate division KSB1 bacterium]